MTIKVDYLYLLASLDISYTYLLFAPIRLNFDGKVTMASIKNFILCNNEQEQIMQFGRTGNNDFYLDVQWPLSLFQAFAIALSSFDSKLGCD